MNLRAVLSVAVASTACLTINNNENAPAPAPTPTASVEPDAAPPPDGSAADVAPPASESGVFLAQCVVTIANKDPTQALRFHVDATRADGKLTLTAEPLIGWNTTTNMFVDRSQIFHSSRTGSPMTASSTLTGNRFTLNFGTVQLPANANSISGRDMTIEKFTLDGVFTSSTKQFCAYLTGQMTVPYDSTFPSNQNVCLFTVAQLASSLPLTASSSFVCAF